MPKRIVWTADQIANAGETNKLVMEVANAVSLIRPIMTGLPPHVQGAVIAEVLATWLGGHPPPTRIEHTHGLLKTAIELIEHYDQWKGAQDDHARKESADRSDSQ
jgi:hypothetical protein